MRLVKLTIHKITNKLRYKKLTLFVLSTAFFTTLFSQDNSPYSRYGIGDLLPQNNILNRAMGGISAGFSNPVSVNFRNPASYSSFLTVPEVNSKKGQAGIAVLDIGINYENRTLRETNKIGKFTVPNTYFSYIQLGIPLRKNWGMAFGLKPVSKINYNIARFERLIDPNTQLPIDSAITSFKGEGGAYIASLGTGFAIKNLSLGFNVGYFFGKKDISTARTLINDSVAYTSGNFKTLTSYGDFYLDAGIQYKIPVDKRTTVTLGAFGNAKQNIKASQDITKETFYKNNDGQYIKIDSVSEKKEIAGSIVYPSTLGLGFTIEKKYDLENKKGGWLIGLDYVQSKWSQYRFLGSTDLVQDSKELHIGGQVFPVPSGRNYWSYVQYRAGFFSGTDYINVENKLPVFGVSAGLSLPILNLKDPQSRFRTQSSVINLSFEYVKRGNNNNSLKENMFRMSAGFSLADRWFQKRKYQ